MNCVTEWMLPYLPDLVCVFPWHIFQHPPSEEVGSTETSDTYSSDSSTWPWKQLPLDHGLLNLSSNLRDAESMTQRSNDRLGVVDTEPLTAADYLECHIQGANTVPSRLLCLTHGQRPLQERTSC